MDKIKRKLATILAADCVNFSKHMEANEEKTLKNLNDCRVIIDKKIKEFEGRIFNTAGDSVIAEFDSPVQCVKAAIEFQEELIKRNEHSITELRLEWRVGIHVDDVMVEGDNIMGSGVNVAARLESQCKPGQILVSRIVKDQVSKRVNFSIDADGTRELKNISSDFEVFVVGGLSNENDDFLTKESNNSDQNSNSFDSKEKAKIEKSKKIKLAVLPFENLSKDDDSEFLVEGIFRDLITEFSRMQEFDVISQQTSLDFKKSNDDALTFAKKHKIDFLIGGNIRSAGKRIRISVDLTDANDGSVLWGDKYDRILEDIFDIQDEIVQKMSRQLLGNIEISSLQRMKRKPSENLNSYEWLIRGNYHHVRRGKDHNTKAIEAFDKAIELDNSNARAHALKACTIGGGLGKGYYDNNEERFDILKNHIAISLEADENDFECLRISSALSLLDKDFKKAEEHGQKGFSINPNDPRVLNQYGKVLVKIGKVDEGIKHLHKAFELDPIPQGHLTSCDRYDALVLGYFCNEEYDKCISFGKKITNLEPGTWLIVLCAISEQEDIVNLKDNSFYKNKYDEFKDKEWEKVIANFYFPPDSSVHKKLEEFSTKIFPPLKLVESVSA